MWGHRSPDLLPGPHYSLWCTVCPGDQQWYPPWELWGALYQHCLLIAKGSIKFPKCLLKQEKTNSLSQKQHCSAGCDQRSRALFPLLSSPWQGRIQWEHVIIGPYQWYTQNTSLSHAAKGAYRSLKIPHLPVQPSEPIYNLGSECSTFLANTGQLPSCKHVKPQVLCFFSRLLLIYVVWLPCGAFCWGSQQTHTDMQFQ